MAKQNEYEDVFKHIDMSAGEDACWPWTGPINRKGLPYFTVAGRKYVSYRLVKWLVQKDFNLLDERIIPLHQCKGSNGEPIDNPLCCNPAHTRMGTHEENTQEMMLRGRSGLPKEAIRDIIQISKEFPELTHGQIGKRIEYKHKVKCARQTVTDVLNKRRRAVLQDAIEGEEVTFKEGEEHGRTK